MSERRWPDWTKRWLVASALIEDALGNEERIQFKPPVPVEEASKCMHKIPTATGELWVRYARSPQRRVAV